MFLWFTCLWFTCLCFVQLHVQPRPFFMTDCTFTLNTSYVFSRWKSVQLWWCLLSLHHQLTSHMALIAAAASSILRDTAPIWDVCISLKILPDHSIHLRSPIIPCIFTLGLGFHVCNAPLPSFLSSHTYALCGWYIRTPLNSGHFLFWHCILWLIKSFF